MKFDPSVIKRAVERMQQADIDEDEVVRMAIMRALLVGYNKPTRDRMIGWVTARLDWEDELEAMDDGSTHDTD